MTDKGPELSFIEENSKDISSRTQLIEFLEKNKGKDSEKYNINTYFQILNKSGNGQIIGLINYNGQVSLAIRGNKKEIDEIAHRKVYEYFVTTQIPLDHLLEQIKVLSDDEYQDTNKAVSTCVSNIRAIQIFPETRTTIDLLEALHMLEEETFDNINSLATPDGI